MAITAMEYMCFLSLRTQNFAPPNPTMLDFGPSNWHGDVSVVQLRRDIERLVMDPHRRTQILEKLTAVEKSRRPSTYDLAQICFQGILGVSHYSAIDTQTPDTLTPGSNQNFNLNEPVPLEKQFDICLNSGAAEHVFNVYQFFKTVHELTVPGGLMIHNSPFSGSPDHGFFNFQPTLYFDLALANQYTILAMMFGSYQPAKHFQINKREEIAALIAKKKIPPNAHLLVLLRKSPEPVEFSAPAQGMIQR